MRLSSAPARHVVTADFGTPAVSSPCGIDRQRLRLPVCALLLGLGTACQPASAPQAADASSPAPRQCRALEDAIIAIPAGQFRIGSGALYPEEGPPQTVHLDRFWIDAHEVTNRQFARFVADTGYRTVAERPVDPASFTLPREAIPPQFLQPGSAVFTPPAEPSTRYTDWWTYVPGASWRRPTGPGGTAAQNEVPVVHLADADMRAYARWAGGRLPTEAEWEYAARAGAASADSTAQPDEANSWQGAFPLINDATDGFAGIAPVGCYAPNPWGLYDMIGNVWEATADRYAPGHGHAADRNPRGPSETDAYDPANPGLPTRVMKGGSYLCAPNYCQRYRPAARTGHDPGLGSSNVGFRLAYDHAPARP